MLTAFGAAFLGAVVGVVGQAVWTRRHDAALLGNQEMIAARLVRGELQLATAGLLRALKQDQFVGMEGISVDAWRRHGPSLAGLSSESFDVVLQAASKLDAAVRNATMISEVQRRAIVPTSAKLSKIDGAAAATRDLVELCDRAIVALGPIAYPGEKLRAWPPADRFAGATE